MGAKLKSMTHLLNTFFDFLSRFCAFGFKVIKKCEYEKKILFLSKKTSKTQNFKLISDPLKKLLKMHTKSYTQIKFDEHE
jgi:hypothetical protein